MDHETVSRDLRCALGGMAMLAEKGNENDLAPLVQRLIELSKDWTEFSNAK